MVQLQLADALHMANVLGRVSNLPHALRVMHVTKSILSTKMSYRYSALYNMDQRHGSGTSECLHVYTSAVTLLAMQNVQLNSKTNGLDTF